MSASPITDTANPGIARGCWHRSTHDFLPEEQFLNTLRSEKQRSERSGNSLLLALVHLNGSRWNERGDQLTKAITQALRSMVRETDTAGWYQDNTVLGVMFTELRESARDHAQASIDAKLRQVLYATLPGDTAELTRVSYHLFPERDGGPGDPALYRDGTPGAGKAARILKRCLDVTGSLLALAALSPLLLLIALAVKLTSKGPVCCRQTRVGEGGRTFTFFKFRSMFHNSDPSLHRDYVSRMIAGHNVAQVHSSGTGIYKIVNDPRVTPIGRILRRSSLDELPQLFNVLKGDMSLIGPRPPLPYEFERYSAWHRRRVLEARPGLTGLWQVHGRSRTSFDDAVRLDLQYVRQWSLWLDLKILLKTPAAVISGNGAY
jgi:lipopolysaccharide/colanic/teichoic acid biosynthesis glycosyltransferase